MAAAEPNKVEQENLKDFLESVQTYSLADMIRKGRDTKHKYVTVEKGENGFLSDTFRRNEGVDLPNKRVWLARETLLCNGKGNCLRACGGFGKCTEGKNRY